MSTSVAVPRQAQALGTTPTIWGLTPEQVHDRFWASRGVQVVRRGEPSEFVEAAELFLLIDTDTLVTFRLRDLVELLSWLDPKLLSLRIRDDSHSTYREVVRFDEDGSFQGFERAYEGLASRLTRVGLTPDREVARRWQSAESASAGWRSLRALIPLEDRQSRRFRGRVFDASREDQQMAYLECVIATWSRPDSTVPRAARLHGDVWADSDANVDRDARTRGRVWVGAGREVGADDFVMGPAVLWDAPDAELPSDAVPWQDLEPVPVSDGLAPRPFYRTRMAGKRLFDIVFSLVMLAFTLPLYPFIAIAIMIEDGWPVFFAHQRETVGGKQFPCLKFRSMRRDAEQIKAKLQAANQSDGPQFFMEKDPRLTRVGAFLRKTQLDEIPQFLNVLVGHMSVVGPRPSPRRENQFCPGWREARLSVRPGITGLWQVSRTREEGLDFQEWIRYDLEYVEHMNWRMDLAILWRTIAVVLRKGRN